MTLQDGLWLLGGVVVLYLYDSALLLFHNEVVMIGRHRGYAVSAGSGFELRGRHLFVPSPLCPHQPLFRLSWPERGVPVAGAATPRIRRVRVALAALSYWMMLLLTLFGVALPYVLLVARDSRWLLAWFVAVYLVIAGILVQVWRYRKALNLSRGAVAAVALDALLCAPFALNIVRKIALRQRLDVDLRTVASSVLPPDAWPMLTSILRQRIQTSLGHFDADEPASRALVAYLDDLERLRR